MDHLFGEQTIISTGVHYNLSDRLTRNTQFALLGLHILLAFYLHFAVGIGVYTDSKLNWDWMWQNIPIRLLQQKPIESIWYLHSVPPLPNLLMALLVKISSNPVVLLHYIHIFLGATISPMVLRILTDQGLKYPPALIVSLIVASDPSLILFEAFFLYDVPTTAILVASVYCLSRFTVTQKPAHLIGFIAILTLGALIRSALHIAFIIICIGIGVYLAKQWRRKFLIVALICILPLIGWIGKNAVQFRLLGTSSWIGLSLWKMAATPEGEKLIESLVNSNKIPAYLPQLGRYPLPENFGPYGYTITSPIEVLNLNNYNNIGIVAFSKISQQAAIELIKASPAHYFRSVINSYLQFCKPTARSSIVEGNAELIPKYVDWHTRYISGTFLWVGKRVNQLGWYWFGFPLFLGLNLARLGILFKHHRNFEMILREATLLFIMFLVLYIVAISCLIEGSEGDRYKLYIEHLFWILVILTCIPARWKVN